MSEPAEEIRSIIAEQEAAWRAGDAAAFSRAVAEDAVFTNIFGQQFVGREAFERQHAFIFSTIYAGSVLEQRVAHLRFVSDAVALVDTDAAVSGARALPSGPSSEDGVLRTKLLQVFVHREEGWRIASFHNVAVSPPPGG